ncbi:MAG TPA: zinc-ribbon domain containing protein [Dehalococcoidia bacterium]|nr:zinc-ribbon domain containing protein [Dehalococcoidia bacterium]
MSYSDKTLVCRDCGANFVFTVGEQEFYASRGFTNEPSRCSTCRSSRRSQPGSSGSFGGGRGGSGSSYGSSYGSRQMHPAVCAQCGAETQVPFVPRGDKPVYCSSCFEKVRTSGYR